METYAAAPPIAEKDGEQPEQMATFAIEGTTKYVPQTTTDAALTRDVSSYPLMAEATIVSDKAAEEVVCKSPRRFRLQQKKENKGRKIVFKRLSKADGDGLRALKTSLTVLIKKAKMIEAARFPRDHFVAEQIALTVYDIFRKMELHYLSYDHIREHMENIMGVYEFLKIDSPTSAAFLLTMFIPLLESVNNISNKLEIMAGQRVTQWMWLRDEINTYSKPVTLDINSLVASLQQLKQLKILGAGGFGAVYKATYAGVITCTVKLVPLEKFKADKHACVDKVSASMNNNNPYTVKYFSTFITDMAFVTIMEYLRGIDLHKIVKAEGGLNEAACSLILFQLCEAVQYMHTKGFIHRDIKPSNVIIMPGCRMKLIDFDTAKICLGSFISRYSTFFFERSSNEFRDREAAGTAPFLSPEVLKGHPYGRAIDWWSVGVTAFNIVFAKLPFRGDRRTKDLKDLVTAGAIPYPVNRAISKEFRCFIDDCLVHKPSLRFCSASYRELGAQEFFKELTSGAVYRGAVTYEIAAITKFMNYNNGVWTLQEAKFREAPKVNLQLFQLKEASEQVPLFTYCSPRFKKVLAGYPMETETVPENFSPCSDRPIQEKYRFEQYTKAECKQ